MRRTSQNRNGLERIRYVAAQGLTFRQRGSLVGAGACAGSGSGYLTPSMRGKLQGCQTLPSQDPALSVVSLLASGLSNLRRTGWRVRKSRALET